jgi:valyl-tRNA synthetase
MDSMVDADKERGRLRSQIEKLRSAIGPLQQRLGSEGFRSKASPAIIEEVQSTLREKEEQLRLLESRLLELAERGNASS